MEDILSELENIKENLKDEFENTQKMRFYTDFEDAAKHVLEEAGKFFYKCFILENNQPQK